MPVPSAVSDLAGRDRRRAERLPVQLLGRYRGNAHAADIEVTNLSRHGLFIRGGEIDASEGSPIRVEVRLPTGHVTVEGELVRVVDGDLPGAGIRFTHAAPQARRELANYMIHRHCVAQS